MKERINPYIIPGTCMIIVLMVAISIFYHNAHAGKMDPQITAEAAKDISLSHAGQMIEDVTFTKAKLDKDTAVPVYEIEFYTDEKQYRYEINAQTGSVRDRECTVHKKTRLVQTGKGQGGSGDVKGASTKESKESKEISKENQNNEKKSENSNVIGVEKAQNLALKAAGLKRKQVTFTKSSLDTDDGRTVYEIEFLVDGKEYDYDIDAYSGKILESGIDVEDDMDQGDGDRYEKDDDEDDSDDRFEKDDDEDDSDDRYEKDDDNDDD